MCLSPERAPALNSPGMLCVSGWRDEKRRVLLQGAAGSLFISAAAGWLCVCGLFPLLRLPAWLQAVLSSVLF